MPATRQTLTAISLAVAMLAVTGNAADAVHHPPARSSIIDEGYPVPLMGRTHQTLERGRTQRPVLGRTLVDEARGLFRPASASLPLIMFGFAALFMLSTGMIWSRQLRPKPERDLLQLR